MSRILTRLRALLLLLLLLLLLVVVVGHRRRFELFLSLFRFFRAAGGKVLVRD